MTFKTLLLCTITTVSFFSANTMAKTNSEMSCNANVNSNIVFANNSLTLESTKQESIVFSANGNVLVDNKKVLLTASEQKVAQDYYTQIEASIPMVVDITVDALEITEVALSEVFKGLLGSDSQVPAKLTLRLNELAASVKNHVYQNPDSLTFNSKQLENDIGVGAELDQEIEQIKAEVVSSVMGQLVIAIGQSMISGGGNFTELESRMENLAQDIETKAEILGDRLRKSTEGLCDKVEILDALETQLRDITELRNLRTIEFTKKA